MHERRALLVVALATAACTEVAFAQSSVGKAAAERAYREAVARPTDPAVIESFKRVVPRLGDDYVVEGDRLMTESQLAVYMADPVGGCGGRASESWRAARPPSQREGGGLDTQMYVEP